MWKKEGKNYREVGGRRTSVEEGGYQLDELDLIHYLLYLQN